MLRSPRATALAVYVALAACADDPPRGARDAETVDAAAAADARAAVDATASDTPDAASPPDAEDAPDGRALADADVAADARSEADAGGPPTVRKSAGCGRAAAPGLIATDTMVNGLSRHYQVYVPPNYDPSQPLALVFTFHGLGGDGDQIRAYLSLESASAGQALIVYPDGRVLPGQRATGWEEPDLLFFDAMLAEAAASYCVDLDRVFATGHSFGAYMTDTLGCRRGAVLRAIAPLSGGTLGGACDRPMPVWMAHGNADPTVPQSEGIAARDHWLSVNGCASQATPSSPADCVRYEGCPAAPVVWCSFAGGHFPLPSYARSAIWSFFAAQ